MERSPVEELLNKSHTIEDLSAASALLGWDQETYMPEGASEARSHQISTVSTIIHEMYVEEATGELIEQAAAEVGEDDWRGEFIREFRRTRENSVKLPVDFVREMSKARSTGQTSWRRARQASDFSLFRDDLSHIVDIKRRHAEYLGYEENPYDALLDLFEPGMTASMLRPVFSRLKAGTVRLLEKIGESSDTPDDSLLTSGFSKEGQMEFSRRVITALGFDFETGRVDLSAHPFCTSFATSDVRLTTRIYENDVRSCFFGLVHEAGHGMYEQGIDPRYRRTALASGTSMGIHESQSLFWENTIARSPEFWEWAFPTMADVFPEQLKGESPESLYRKVNRMQPSFIRVEADELTYNLHIILRFEIEDDLINGRLEVKDIPDAWNSKMEEYLGIVPSNDSDGLLQDVHWAFGGHGYFPSYTLGKLYAAMFNQAMLKEIPHRSEQVQKGEFSETLSWLRTNVHRWGKAKTPAELMRDVCGEELSEVAFLDYIEAKIVDVYRLG